MTRTQLIEALNRLTESIQTWHALQRRVAGGAWSGHTPGC
jgi:hypothetical protein